MKSQGIIHGGAKYALHGALTGASEAIADMPRRWRACLGSDGELDLQACACFPRRTTCGRRAAWPAAYQLLRQQGGAQPGRAGQGRGFASALRDKGFKGKAYRLTEIVFDVPDLIRRLAELAGDSLLAGERIEPLREGRELAGLCVDGREIRAQRVVLSAGAGNEALLRELGLEQPAMQRRPLHMVMVKAATLKPLYAHCLGAGPKPRITVTTHPTRDGQSVWYLGGDIAEADGVARDEAAQIAEARRELAKLLPWIDLGQAQWATLRVDRAEPAQSNLLRPDNAFLAEQGRLLVGWPTKLALALTSPTGSAPAWKKTASAPANMPRCRDCRVRRSPNRPGRWPSHDQGYPPRPAPPAGRHRPGRFAAGPGHRQVRPRPG